MKVVDHPLFQTWSAMRARCYNVNASNYHNYGGRGISIGSRWDSFQAFVQDMGDRPKGHTLDRKDVNGNYKPDNCRWATYKTQLRNKRNNRLLTFNGVTQCVAAWAEELKLNNRTILTRLRRGWSVEESLTPARR